MNDSRLNSEETDSPIQFYDAAGAIEDDDVDREQAAVTNSTRSAGHDAGLDHDHDDESVQMLRLRVTKQNSSNNVAGNPMSTRVSEAVIDTTADDRSERSISVQSFISSITSGSAERQSVKESASESESASVRRGSAASMAESVSSTSNDDDPMNGRSPGPDHVHGGGGADSGVPVGSKPRQNGGQVSGSAQEHAKYGFGQPASVPVPVPVHVTSTTATALSSSSSAPVRSFVSSIGSLFGIKRKDKTVGGSGGIAGKAMPVPVKTINKRHSEFEGQLYRTQSIRVHQGIIWTLKFSPDGCFLASGGQDGRIIIWSVGLADGEEIPVAGDGERDTTVPSADNFQLLTRTPFHIFQGHVADVIDLAWSKSNFLLSASIDKTVRLWHVSRDDCLQVFRHNDIVTGIAFHPTHDRYFVSSCFDRRVRIWDIIPDGVVKDWCHAPDVITAVSFTPDGSEVAVGLYFGQVYFYDAEGLKYRGQILCQNHSGSLRHGAKVTGLEFLKTSGADAASCAAVTSTGSTATSAAASVSYDSSSNINTNTSGSATVTNAAASASATSATSATITEATTKSRWLTGAGAVQLLVTTNDSNTRLVNMTDSTILCKYKGSRNSTMQIRSTFSEDGRYIICGSEVGKVFVWNTVLDEHNTGGLIGGDIMRMIAGATNQQGVLKNTSCEYFPCCGNVGAGVAGVGVTGAGVTGSGGYSPPGGSVAVNGGGGNAASGSAGSGGMPASSNLAAAVSNTDFSAVHSHGPVSVAAVATLFAPSASVLRACGMNHLRPDDVVATVAASSASNTAALSNKGKNAASSTMSSASASHRSSLLCSSVIVCASAQGSIEVFVKKFW